MDFSQFDFEPNQYDVVLALNSLIYLFNNPDFRGASTSSTSSTSTASPSLSFVYPYVYLKQLLLSIRQGGVFFIDKTTYNLYLRDSNKEIDGIHIKDIADTILDLASDHVIIYKKI
eukprot:TRINITY_DN7633_c0_g1_i1.p1 TRINITY_DN7633_c0_g1~~TRINITY_DN7633_c0_g1_i1.p1  ORF type:complete len:116 (+),score=21.43 TRINITY_DN7633_c0_g1_i1:494-841(+)